jgi:hypothetical protein
MTAALSLTITQGGLARFTEAQLAGDLKLSIASVGLTDADILVAPTLTSLPGEFRRLDSISGEAVGDNIIHMVMRDDEPVGYTAKGFGLYFEDGTLFGVYGQPALLFEKSPLTTFMSAIDIAFPAGDITSLVFGDANFLNPPATTEKLGVVELATDAETQAGTDPRRVPSVLALSRAVTIWIKNALDGRLGIGAPTDWAKGLLGAATPGAGRGLLGLGGAAQKASDFYAESARTVKGTGLVTGGGALSSDQELAVRIASADDVKAGTANDRAITPAALAAARLADFGPIGRRIGEDGFIDMWGGAIKPDTEGQFTLNFPWPFPTACLGVVATVLNTTLTSNGQTTIQEVSLAPDHAVLFAQNHQAALNEVGGFRFRAWGY